MLNESFLLIFVNWRNILIDGEGEYNQYQEDQVDNEEDQNYGEGEEWLEGRYEVEEQNIDQNEELREEQNERQSKDALSEK